MHDKAIWKTAPPLWRDGLSGTLAFDRPAILRFETDDFMTRFQAHLDDEEHRDVKRFVIRHETWREPAVGLDGGVDDQVPRLYQPVHGRFYLVAGGLVCARYGLPDKVIHPTCGESAFYVVRRLEPTGTDPVDPSDRSTYRELGWVPAGSGGQWIEVTDGLVPGEERLALFPMTYLDGRRRRVLAGLVPVSGRERYEAAVPPTPVDVGESDDPAAVLALPGRAVLENIVIGFQALLQLAASEALQDGLANTVVQFREATFFALVDLATILADTLPTVWEGTASTGDRGTLVDLLTGNDFGSAPTAPTWMSALHQAYARRDSVLSDLDDAPTPVTGMTVDAITTGVDNLGVGTGATTSDPLFLAIDAAMREEEAATPPPPEPTPVDGAPPSPPPSRMEGGLYAARCVYERPRFRPPERLTLSEPTAPFRLAHFYDPDAPFRDNRIVLPIDTSLDGLRKFPKAVKMELSAQLRKQMDRIQAIKLEDLDNGDIPDEKPLDLGMICSLSIPIITICALVLLMIIVSLLNIVFFWTPLFKICLPKET